MIEDKRQLKKKTKERVRKMLKEFSKKPKMKLFQNTEKYDQIIAQVGIPITALCEHHKVPFQGQVFIGYIPRDYVIGLSKLARVAEYFLNPTVETTQEKATHLILNYLRKEIQPKGLMVVIKATHSCISYRGVKKPSLTITSAVYGIFATDNGAKNEFLQLINSNN